MSKTALTEIQIQRQILDYLALKKIFAIRINIGGVRRNGKWCPSPNVTKGVSDILVLHQGVLTAIEVKRPGGKISEDQIDFLNKIIHHGGKTLIAWSLEDVVNLFG